MLGTASPAPPLPPWLLVTSVAPRSPPWLLVTSAAPHARTCCKPVKTSEKNSETHKKDGSHERGSLRSLRRTAVGHVRALLHI